MRLSTKSQSAIQEIAREIFGDVQVRLYGSRTNDDLKGGDLDLLIESANIIEDKERKLLQLVARLQMRIGYQPIDVLLLDAQTTIQPIHKEALQKGVVI